MDLLAVGPATFEGHATMDTRQREVEGAYPGGIPDGVANLTEIHNYARRTGPAEVTYYGNTSQSSRTVSSSGVTVISTGSGRTVLVPPWARPEYALPLGGSATVATAYHHHGVTTTTVTGQAPDTRAIDSQVPTTETIRFVRRESITVPAGTFDACVFESTWQEDPGAKLTEWVADGKGFPLKRVDAAADGSTATTTTLSLRFNGQPVTN
ncbi:MAG: hypothetical protein QM750_27955 [Rubrivivax sp.]